MRKFILATSILTYGVAASLAHAQNKPLTTVDQPALEPADASLRAEVGSSLALSVDSDLTLPQESPEQDDEKDLSATKSVEEGLSEFDSQFSGLFAPSKAKIEYPSTEMSITRTVFKDVNVSDPFGNPLPPGRVAETEETTLRLDMTWQEVLDAKLGIDGTRSAVLTITAGRHPILLQKLKAASDSEKKQVLEALGENYQAHYQIETWWRTKKLEKLEEQIATLKKGIDQRNGNQTKYVDAAVTIAGLYSEGVSAAPPVPSAGTTNRSFAAQPYGSFAAFPAPYYRGPVPSPTLPPSTTPPRESFVPSTSSGGRFDSFGTPPNSGRLESSSPRYLEDAQLPPSNQQQNFGEPAELGDARRY